MMKMKKKTKKSGGGGGTRAGVEDVSRGGEEKEGEKVEGGEYCLA